MKKLLLLALSVGAFAACARTKVSVVCVGQKEGVQCTLAEVSGNKKAHTCWDVSVKCDNKTQPTASECDDVTKDKPTVHMIAFDKFKDGDKCDKVTPNTFAVTNIKVTQ